jgi:hypothetical protein
MNTIQEISLKLQLGIDPSHEVPRKDLRRKWCHASAEKFGSDWEASKDAPGLFKTAQMAAMRRLG